MNRTGVPGASGSIRGHLRVHRFTAYGGVTFTEVPIGGRLLGQGMDTGIAHRAMWYPCGN